MLLTDLRGDGGSGSGSCDMMSRYTKWREVQHQSHLNDEGGDPNSLRSRVDRDQSRSRGDVQYSESSPSSWLSALSGCPAYDLHLHRMIQIAPPMYLVHFSCCRSFRALISCFPIPGPFACEYVFRKSQKNFSATVCDVAPFPAL